MRQGAFRRFPIRYSIQRWNDNLWFYGSLFVVLVLLIIAKLLLRQSIGDIVLPLLLVVVVMAALWLMRVFSYVEIGDDALRVRYIMRRIELPFASLSRVRRQPLEIAFQPAERRRYVNRFVRRLAREPAAYIRVDRRKEDLLREAERRLGQRLVAGADIVLPLLGVDEFVDEMKVRLRGPAGS
jgi:biopolymer transport protein ExbB/TolQ